MSSVGSADKRSGQDEVTRATRESYQQKEAEQVKRHAQSMKRMSEAHRKEIAELEAQHNLQISELKNRASEAISARDLRYQKEMEELRSMHQKNVQRQANESETARRQIESVYKSQAEANKAAQTQQTELMRGQFTEDLKRKDAEFEDFAKRTREASQKSLGETRRKLNQAHE